MLRIALAIKANPSKREHTSVFIHAPQPPAHIIASQTLVPIPNSPSPRFSSASPSTASRNPRTNPFDSMHGVKYRRRTRKTCYIITASTFASLNSAKKSWHLPIEDKRKKNEREREGRKIADDNKTEYCRSLGLNGSHRARKIFHVITKCNVCSFNRATFASRYLRERK